MFATQIFPLEAQQSCKGSIAELYFRISHWLVHIKRPSHLFAFIYQENPHHEGVQSSAALYQWWSSLPKLTAARQQQTPQPRWEWQAVGKKATDASTGCTPLLWRGVKAAPCKGWGERKEKWEAVRDWERAAGTQYQLKKPTNKTQKKTAQMYSLLMDFVLDNFQTEQPGSTRNHFHENLPVWLLLIIYLLKL